MHVPLPRGLDRGIYFSPSAPAWGKDAQTCTCGASRIGKVMYRDETKIDQEGKDPSAAVRTRYDIHDPGFHMHRSGVPPRIGGSLIGDTALHDARSIP